MRVSEGTRRDHPRVGPHANAVPLRTGAVSRFRADRRGRGPGSRVPLTWTLTRTLTWTSTTVERQLSSRVVAGSLGARPCGGHCAVQGRRGHGHPWSSAGATPRPRKSAWNFGPALRTPLGGMGNSALHPRGESWGCGGGRGGDANPGSPRRPRPPPPVIPGPTCRGGRAGPRRRGRRGPWVRRAGRRPGEAGGDVGAALQQEARPALAGPGTP